MTTASDVTAAIREHAHSTKRIGSMMFGSFVGEIQLSDTDKGRLDAVTFWTKSDMTRLEGWEIKVSRSDFLTDVTNRKYERYEPLVDGFWFAVAEGIAQPSELPKRIGFMVVRPDGTYRVIRRPQSTTSRIEGRQMDRIAVRLAEIAERRLEQEAELRRAKNAMDRMCALNRSSEPGTSRWWTHWLNEGVRERIIAADDVLRREDQIISDAEYQAKTLINNAERRASQVNIDERLQRWEEAKRLVEAAESLLTGSKWDGERRMSQAIDIAQRWIDEHKDPVQ